MDIRYKGAQVEGSNGVGCRRQVEVRKVHPHHQGELARAFDGNNLDEIVAQNSKGDQFIIFSDELASNKGLPAVGETITLNGEALKVVRVDNEVSEKAVGAVAAVGAIAAGVYVGGTVGVGALAKGGTGWVLGKIGLSSAATNMVMGGVTGLGVVRGAGTVLGLFTTDPSELYRISSPL